MNILGISGLYHDSAASLVQDGIVVCAAQEERFTRKKNDPSLPIHAIDFCLNYTGIQSKDLDAVVYYDNPLLTLDRFLKSCVSLKEQNESLILSRYESIFGDKLWIHRHLGEYLGSFGRHGKLLVCEHHLSHAAYTFYQSPWKDAAILTIDGVGEWATTTLALGEGGSIQILFQIDYPDSLGLFYSAFTYFCGFRVNSGEYKLMGLAPYGTPAYTDLIKRELIDIKQDGSYCLNPAYFSYQYGTTMTSENFEKLFQCERRKPETPFHKIHLDLAASVQHITEEIILKTAFHLKKLTGKSNVCLGGGVALNCVANGLLVRERIFDHVFIAPAAGDAGGSAGSALYAYHQYFKMPRRKYSRRNLVYLGPSFEKSEEIKCLNRLHAVYREAENLDSLLSETVDCLIDGQIVGFFHGRMEFGPRALGNRSILANPMNPDMQLKLNLKVKRRESFRPFAPSVLMEHCGEWFDLCEESPYMLLTAQVKREKQIATSNTVLDPEDILGRVRQIRSVIPAVTHVDGSARVQTVSQENNPVYYQLIQKFYERTGCPILINTSFNVRGEPIVCTPKDAYRCFMSTEMDVLVMDELILHKDMQPDVSKEWVNNYEPD